MVFVAREPWIDLNTDNRGGITVPKLPVVANVATLGGDDKH